MATLTTVNEPKYNLRVSEGELKVLRALIGSTSGASLARALDAVFMERTPEGDLPPDLPFVGTLWDALDPR